MPRPDSITKCPYHKPSTNNTRLRIFFAAVKTTYSWPYTLKDFEGWDGCFATFMEKLYKSRNDEFPGYGEKLLHNRLSSSDEDKVCLSSFDESCPKQHQMKILFGFAIYFGFRGKMEHQNMMVTHIQKGTFEDDHPFSNKRYVGIRCLLDKRQKLTIHNPYSRDVGELMRVPCLSDDVASNDFGSSLERYLKKLDSSQTKLYCMTKPEKHRNEESSPYYFKKPMGKDSIQEPSLQVSLDLQQRGSVHTP